MKKIYWIDDNFEEMIYIMQGAIKKLWHLDEQETETERIRSQIIVFGNAYQEENNSDVPSQNDENNALEMINEQYEKCCITMDGPNPERPVFNSNLGLVRNAVTYPLKKENAEEASEYQNILASWNRGKKEELGDEEYEVAKERVTKLLERMHFDDGAVVGIDLLLMFYDCEHILEQQRVLSMELYNQMTSRGYRCFLYSSEAGIQEIVENWKNTYCKWYFTDEQEDSRQQSFAEIKIFERKDFLRKGRYEAILEIEKLLIDA